MSDNLIARLKAMQDLNAQIRHQAEHAEARVATANPLIAQLAASGLVGDQILIGQFLLIRGYSARFPPKDSGQVIQAALAVPGGFGAVVWDSERTRIGAGQSPLRVRGILAIRAFCTMRTDSQGFNHLESRSSIRPTQCRAEAHLTRTLVEWSVRAPVHLRRLDLVQAKGLKFFFDPFSAVRTKRCLHRAQPERFCCPRESSCRYSLRIVIGQ